MDHGSLTELLSRRPWPVRQSDRALQTSHVARAPSRELVALLESSDPGLGLAFTCSSGSCLETGPGTVRLRRLNNNTQCKDCFRSVTAQYLLLVTVTTRFVLDNFKLFSQELSVCLARSVRTNL